MGIDPQHKGGGKREPVASQNTEALDGLACLFTSFSESSLGSDPMSHFRIQSFQKGQGDCCPREIHYKVSKAKTHWKELGAHMPKIELGAEPS